MSAGPLVVTYRLTGRSRAIVTEELSGAAEESISSIWRQPTAPARSSVPGRCCPTTRRRNCVERLIGSIRRECLDHVVVLGERHLRYLLANYATYYNGVRTHLALDKDSPLHRPAQTVGRIASVTWLGGLHRHYVRMA